MSDRAVSPEIGDALTSIAAEADEERPKSRGSCGEDDARERTMVADEIEQAEEFNLTIEYVDVKPDDQESDEVVSSLSGQSGPDETSDEHIELAETSEKTISPVTLSVSPVKKPADKRRSMAMELLADWTPLSSDRKRRSNVVDEDQSTPKRQMTRK